jgi:hypothetical protein
LESVPRRVHVECGCVVAVVVVVIIVTVPTTIVVIVVIPIVIPRWSVVVRSVVVIGIEDAIVIVVTGRVVRIAGGVAWKVGRIQFGEIEY